jgi:hypothetical protein
MMLDQLRVLLRSAIDTVHCVPYTNAAWNDLPVGSQAGAELMSEEGRRPAPQTGSWPWLGALLIGRWALQVTIEEAEALQALLKPDTTSYAADVLSRGVLESASLAWWLLDPDIDAQQRTARSLIYRLHSAAELERAVDALELDPREARSGYGESVADVQKEIAGAGVGWSTSGKQVLFGDRQERWPRYTARVATLVGAIWPKRDLPYRMLSAVAHAEVLGLTRNLASVTPGASALRPVPDDATTMWFWQDAYLASGALVLTAERAASFLGLEDQTARLAELISSLQHELSALRPEV